MLTDQRNSANEQCSLSGDLATREIQFPRSDTRLARRLGSALRFRLARHHH